MVSAETFRHFPGAVDGCVVGDGHPPGALQFGVEEGGQAGAAARKVSLLVVDGNGYVNGLGHAAR